MPIRELFPTQIIFFVLFSVLSYLFSNTPPFFRWANKQAYSLYPQMLSTWSEVWVLRSQVKEAVLLPSASRSRPVPLWDGIPPETGKSTMWFHSSRRAHPGGPMTEETHRLIREYWSHHLLSEGDRWPLPCFLSHFRMDTSSSPVTSFLLTVWRQWTATAGCWDAPQASTDMLVSMGPAGRADGWECTEGGGSGTFHRLQGHESHLQVAACGSRDLKTRYIPRNTSVTCHVFQGTFRNKQSHLPKSTPKASSLDPTASVLHSPTHKASNSTISTTKFLSVFFGGGAGEEHCLIKLKKNSFCWKWYLRGNV